MKIDKEAIFLYGSLIAFVLYFIYGEIQWKTEKKRYAVGYVYDIQSIRGAGPMGVFYMKINGKRYEGTVGHGNTNVNKHFIVEFVENTPRMCRIVIEKPIKRYQLVPQPPGGWEECPIKENGAIKEKFRAKN